MLRIARKHPRIAVDPAIMVGSPCITATRMPVDVILRELGDGLTPAPAIEAHPFLTPEHIAAVQAFAADVVTDEAEIGLRS